METTIKPFLDLSLEELYDILALRTDVFVVEQECPYPEVDGRDKDCQHVQVREGDELVAYLRILPRGLSFEEVSIGRVLVKQGHRSKGLARPMMQAAMDFILTEWKEDAIRISAQTYLEAFYASFGFEPVSEPYLEDGIPHLDMLYTAKRS